MLSWLQQRLKDRTPNRDPAPNKDWRPNGKGLPPVSQPKGKTPGSLAEWWHFHMTDHGILRAVWSNFAEIAPGVWRSNQPSAARLERYRAKGLRSILNLRGASDNSFSVIESSTCDRLGIRLVGLRLSARQLPDRATLRDIRATMKTLEKPFLIHCKSGADRTGFASALYLLMIEQRPVAEAKQQLHWRHLHFAFTRSGILDHFLDAYAKAKAATGIDFNAWVDSVYDPATVTASYGRKETGGSAHDHP